MGILVLIIVIAAIYIILRNNNTNIFTKNRNVNHKEDALEILKRRLASGEISEEEFEKKKEILKNN